jgi:hypothetical protein
MRFEWRSKKAGDDALLAVNDEGSSVVHVWTADGPLITDFLNDMDRLEAQHNQPNGLDIAQRVPQYWGPLVMARSEKGDILHVDPELYWDRLTFWFRSRGLDPHSWSESRARG